MADVVTKSGRIDMPDEDARIRAHDALRTAAERASHAAWKAQHKRGKPPARFSPPPEVGWLVEAMPMALDGRLSPEEAMATLHQPDILRARLGK